MVDIGQFFEMVEEQYNGWPKYAFSTVPLSPHASKREIKPKATIITYPCIYLLTVIQIY